ncbi:MAG: alpha/beta hydrolase [Betaproteobacteria bacterium]|nr:alpha/beta hydrolase [Betaproteobacteria bacterium]
MDERAVIATQLDPQVRELLARLAATSTPPMHTLSPAEARVLYKRTRLPLQPPPVAVADLRDTEFPGGAGQATGARIYRPLGSTPDELLPAIVYFHGGGWVYGDLDSHDAACRALANQSRAAVLSIAYRLAPEHKFPAAFDDAVAAVHWAARESAALGIDRDRLVVAGDSAGGNLAAAAALALRGDSEVTLAMQLLFYPALDHRMDTPSHAAFARGYLLERESLLWCRDHYLRGADDIADWRASPLLAPDHRGLPATYIITAGFDPLRDDGAAYAERLSAAEVTVTYECFEGLVHGFLTMGGVLAATNHAFYRAGQALRVGTGGSPAAGSGFTRQPSAAPQRGPA